MINDLVSLLFPKVCATCGTSLLKDEEVICTHCCVDLPFTKFTGQEDNPVAKLLWGRVEVASATSGFLYKNNSPLQELIHQLKYKGNVDSGMVLGRMLGLELITSDIFSSVDCLIPVPLHKSKKRKRGYNQSEIIASGMSEVMGVPVRTDVLQRKKFTETQTKRSRISRWQNVDGIFELKSNSLIGGEEILLVDDVITTGATIEACVKQLQQVSNVTIHIATVAFSN